MFFKMEKMDEIIKNVNVDRVLKIEFWSFLMLRDWS